MLRAFDLVLVGLMIAAAAVTYTIKHRADLKLAELRRLEAEIRLEKDTIDLLRADWALLTQPVRLQKLVTLYNDELDLKPTQPTQLALPQELPMLRAALPQPDITIEDIIAGGGGEVAAALKAVAEAKARPPSRIPVPLPRATIDNITTGTVRR